MLVTFEPHTRFQIFDHFTYSKKNINIFLLNYSYQVFMYFFRGSIDEFLVTQIY